MESIFVQYRCSHPWWTWGPAVNTHISFTWIHCSAWTLEDPSFVFRPFWTFLLKVFHPSLAKSTCEELEDMED
jgi:hypothetical protein